MAGPSSDRTTEWEGSSLSELVAALSAEALPVRIEVIAPGTANSAAGEVHLLAGGLADAFAGSLRRDDAMAALQRLEGARFMVEARLPDPETGSLSAAGPGEGSLKERSVAALMRYCEEYVLTCRLEVWRGPDRAVISYRRGEIISTMVGGADGSERLPDVMAWSDGSYQIVLPEPTLPQAEPRKGPRMAEAGRAERKRHGTLPMVPTQGGAEAPATGTTPPPITPPRVPAPPPSRTPVVVPTPSPRPPAVPPAASAKPAVQAPATTSDQGSRQQVTTQPLGARPAAPPAQPAAARPAPAPTAARAPAPSQTPPVVPVGRPTTVGQPVATQPPPRQSVQTGQDANALSRPTTLGQPVATQPPPRQSVKTGPDAAQARPVPPAGAQSPKAGRAATPVLGVSTARPPAEPLGNEMTRRGTPPVPDVPLIPAPARPATPAGKAAEASAIPVSPTPAPFQLAQAPGRNAKQPPASNDLKPASGTIEAKSRHPNHLPAAEPPVEIAEQPGASEPDEPTGETVPAPRPVTSPRVRARKGSREQPVKIYVLVGLAIGAGIVVAYWAYWYLPFFRH
jgi:hypothetical protein